MLAFSSVFQKCITNFLYFSQKLFGTDLQFNITQQDNRDVKEISDLCAMLTDLWRFVKNLIQLMKF